MRSKYTLRQDTHSGTEGTGPAAAFRALRSRRFPRENTMGNTLLSVDHKYAPVDLSRIRRARMLWACGETGKDITARRSPSPSELRGAFEAQARLERADFRSSLKLDAAEQRDPSSYFPTPRGMLLTSSFSLRSVSMSGKCSTVARICFCLVPGLPLSTSTSVPTSAYSGSTIPIEIILR